MKKSKAIEELSNYLYSDWSIYSVGIPDLSLVMAEDIIQFLENLGMKPPMIIEEEELLRQYKFKWEDDDEDKI